MMVALASRHARTADATEAAVLEVLRSGRYFDASLLAEAEAAACALFGRRFAVGVASGTDALMLALQVIGVRPGDEVIVPAMTFFATAGAVCAIGARPVVVDVDEAGLLDVAAAAQAVGPKTRAIVPVHLFGAAAPIPDLGVPVVDDAAQCAGGPRPGGQVTAASCYPTKTWGAAGNAGFVLSEDPALVDAARALASHGLVAPHLHAAVAGVVGRNARLGAVQAAVLASTATDVVDRVARRRAIAGHYDAALPSSVRPLPRDPAHPVHHYVARVRDRDAGRARLAELGVETAVYYPLSLARQPALAAWPQRPTPVADALASEWLALPVHEGLSDADVATVVACVREVFGD